MMNVDIMNVEYVSTPSPEFLELVDELGWTEYSPDEKGGRMVPTEDRAAAQVRG